MTARYRFAIALVLAVAGASGCGDSTPTQPAATPTPGAASAPTSAPTGQSAAAKAPAPPPAVRALMSEHFTKATEARTALIAGDMDAARAAMTWLATNELGQEALPEPLRPHLTHVREEATRFAAATTFSQAGDSFAAMLTHCGDCHAQAHLVPRFTDVPQPTGTELRDRMQRQAWAAELFWEGLIAKDQSRYDRAAQAIAGVVVQAGDLPTNTNDPVRVQAVADNVRSLAASGLAAADWTQRAQDYGKFLATCATCHRMMAAGERVRAGLLLLQPAAALPPAQP